MKHKFDVKEVTQVRKNMIKKSLWLESRSKKKDLLCENCKKPHAELEGDIALMGITGQLNKHVCGECAEYYITNGAEDIEAKVKVKSQQKEELISDIKALGNYRDNRMYSKKLSEMSVDDLEAVYIKYSEIKKRQDRIDAIVISKEDSFMEPYLERDHGVIQDVKRLKCEEQIEEFFKGDYSDYFDCGQGYYEDTATVTVKIAKKYYAATMHADIESAKQDRGDRLYWVEDIDRVDWEEIAKPEPKEYQTVIYTLLLNDDEKVIVDRFLKDNGVKQIV